MAASVFLYVVAFAVAVLVALPLLFAPLTWARVVGWRVPEDTDLTVYFARCLGGVLLAMIVVVVRAAPAAAGHGTLFHLIALVAAIMSAVHVVGALEKRQPWFETVEIAIYAALAVAAWCIAP